MADTHDQRIDGTAESGGGWSCLRSAVETAALLLREDRLRGGVGTALILGGALSGPLLGLALASLVEAAAHREIAPAASVGCLAALLAVLQMTAGHFASMLFGELGEQALLTVNARLVRSAQGSATLARQEDSAFADRLSLLQQEIHSLPYVVQAMLQTTAVIGQMVLTVVLLGQLQPLLALLPVAALAPYYTGRYANSLRERARLRNAEDRRRAHALLDLARQPGPMLEIRLAGMSGELQQRQRGLMMRVSRGLLRAEARGALARTAGQLVFAAAYGTALILVVRRVVTGHGTAGDVVLAIVLARQVATGVAQILSLTWALQNAARVGSRLRWILAAAEEDRPTASAGLSAPAELRDGIRLDGVRFRYPGSDTDVLQGIDLDLRAGTVVALVGDNGAGKSTLVKLLCGLYRPSDGRITADGTDLTEIAADRWRKVISCAFQDFVRFEFAVQWTVGIGDLPRAEDPEAVLRALRAVGAESLPQKLPQGLDTPIGKSFPHGRDFSGGEWQKMALSRAMMRRRPVLLVLDEPTAALDAAAEHLQFEQQLARARDACASSGAVTLFVSHRFSTVSMADNIVVLSGGAISEQGSHAELLAAGGGYAELFELQGRGYRTREETPAEVGESAPRSRAGSLHVRTADFAGRQQFPS